MEIELIFKITAIGIIIAILNQLLTKSGKEEYALLSTISGIIIVILMLLPGLKELFAQIKDILEL